MRISPDLSGLEALLGVVGAPRISWRVTGPGLDPLDIKLLDGAVTDGINEIEYDHQGIATWQGRRCVIYIFDSGKDEDTLEQRPELAQRFHFSECKTIDEMRSKNRFARYVATNNLSGQFRVIATDIHLEAKKEVNSNLKVCKNCLSSLNYNNYNNVSLVEKDAIWVSFLLKQFFEKFPSQQTPKADRMASDVRETGYPEDWDSISSNYRKIKRWCCECCQVNLAGHRNLLDCHHRNGVPSDCNPANLRALCKLCHAAQPNHSMHVRADDRVVLRQLRRSQGRPGSCRHCEG